MPQSNSSDVEARTVNRCTQLAAGLLRVAA
jgi:hypothetical protein